RSFVGITSYYQRFVKKIASIATHLKRLTKKEVPFEWTDRCEDNLKKVKTLLTTTHIRTLPVEGKDFIVYCNVSHSGLDVVLMQESYSRTIIYYHLGKTNMVADALSRKTVSMGSLASLGVSKRPLTNDIQTLESKLMQLGISKKGGVLASIEVRPTFIEEIKAKEFKDESLNELRKNIVSGKAQDAAFDAGGVLSFKGRICVP
ncbi:hypothetical protein MTR67_013032, partial [Solanum verrucosum]